MADILKEFNPDIIVNPDRNNNSNNIIIKLSLNNNEHRQFINMLFQIDEYIYNYIHLCVCL